MKPYRYQENAFVIDHYDKAKPFASFLPGVAGLNGVPLWTFYVNRGQGIAGIGIKDKKNPIMPFVPANTAYRTVSKTGFRTFIKLNGTVFEPFAVSEQPNIKRLMAITQGGFSISEDNQDLGFKINVEYLHLVEEPIPGLLRRVTITNTTEQDMTLEGLDGMAICLPYGITTDGFNNASNVLQSWMAVYDIKSNMPYFRIRASIQDSSEVKDVSEGNVYAAMLDDGTLCPIIVDPKVIFGYDDSHTIPMTFSAQALSSLLAIDQITANRVPSAYAAFKMTLKPKESQTIRAVLTQLKSEDERHQFLKPILTPTAFDTKKKDLDDVIDSITKAVKTKSGSPMFDAYVEQNRLDNVLRGGMPISLGGHVYHVYSRKHGDLERDYNWFTIEPEPYSQGNGNFRDINQNRRDDVYFAPWVKEHNIKTFMNLIQLDGYNPLGVNGIKYTLKKDALLKPLISKLFNTHQDEMHTLLTGTFTPGELITYLTKNNVEVKDSNWIDEVFRVSEGTISSSFGEGFWMDHWSYNIDLLDSYFAIYPDKREETMFLDPSYRFTQSHVSVLPRSEKTMLNGNGVRQYGALLKLDREGMAQHGIEMNQHNWVKDIDGHCVKTTLFVKSFTLALTKIASMDPSGLGMMMDGNKPGWNDAMNGLPGLFGSSVGEVFELIRLLDHLLISAEKTNIKTIHLLAEIHQLFKALEALNGLPFDDDARFKKTQDAREIYLDQVRFGVTGKTRELSLSDCVDYIKQAKANAEASTEKAMAIGKGIVPTFFTHEALEYEVLQSNEGEPIISHYGLPKVKVNRFKAHALPFFLEGPARALKVIKDKEVNQRMHDAIQKTGIYDSKLKMYKTSESLEPASNEIGRIKAFSPGWLERESIFLHMTYKYLLGLLKSGLHDAFFEALKTNLIPNIDPEVYGRSTLENSSFLVSSENENTALHGQGFVARLSGSTAEFLSMYIHMIIGSEPFKYENGQLTAHFKPILPHTLFDEFQQFRCTYLGSTVITYINESNINTYDQNAFIKKIDILEGNKTTTLHQGFLPEPFALKLREGTLSGLNIYLSK